MHPGRGRGKRLKMIKKILEIQRREADIDCWIRTIIPVIALQLSISRGINIALLHHLDSSMNPHPFLNRLFDWMYLRNLKRCQHIVVVSKYWEEFLKERGFPNSQVIRNCIDPPSPEITDEEVKVFISRYGFNADKPIVYLGNCQRRKGVAKAYEVLKNSPYQLVTSGKPEVELAVRNLDLSQRNYLTLLKASSVVLTMSLFKEGWNRTAHEAMLFGTPVVGSGKGGMRELLEGGGQTVCEDFSELRGCVENAIRNREAFELAGRKFVAGLSLARFSREWVGLILRVTDRMD